MATITNTAAFAQYRRDYAAVTTTANTTLTSSPTNTALLYAAGPDGSLITRLSSLPRNTLAADTQMQIFMSPDGGTTKYLVMTGKQSAVTPNTSAQISGLSFTQVDGTALYEANPFPLAGQSAFVNTVSSAPILGGTSAGSANAQTCSFAVGVTSLVAGTVIDFEAGLTNTAAMTLQVGTSAATSVVRDYNAAALSAGDVTAGFRYRVWYDGSFWRLVITQRLYVAQATTLADGIVTLVQGVDF